MPCSDFGMAEEQIAARRQQIGVALEQPPLGRLVEIDHHVAAEDRVERAAHRPGMQQVQRLDGDQFAQARMHAGEPFELAAPAQHPARQRSSLMPAMRSSE